QACGSSAAPVGEADLGGPDGLAAAAQEVRELVTLHRPMLHRGRRPIQGAALPRSTLRCRASRGGRRVGGDDDDDAKENAMQARTLGRTGPTVSALGLGAMGMSGVYGVADRSESIATVHAALEAGVTLIDTGDFYAMGHNEMLIGEALKGVPRDRFQISVKFGALRDPAGNWLGYDARPVAVKSALAYTLQRLGLDHIDIYRP